MHVHVHVSATLGESSAMHVHVHVHVCATLGESPGILHTLLQNLKLSPLVDQTQRHAS